MAMQDLQKYKELERKVHEQLYNNLYLLSYCYPTSPDFNRIFKKDMFIKNNKAGFYQVVHYLLDILDPQLTKEKLTSWPPYEIKLENKFRGELLRYINELNNLYDNADIPPIMSSQLISPGGFKFTKFIFKLSQLVMYEHVKKKNSSVLLTLKPSKNTAVTKASIERIKKQVICIESNTRLQLDKFNHLQEELSLKALSMVKSSCDLEQKIMEAKNKLLHTKEDFNRKYTNYPSLNSLKEKFLVLQEDFNGLQNICELFGEAEILMANLKGDNLVLENKDLKLPPEVACGMNSSNEMDLVEMFHRIGLLLQKKSLELPNPTSKFIQTNIKELQKLNDSLSQREKEIVVRKLEIESLMNNMQERLKCLCDLISMPAKRNNPIVYVSDADDMLGGWSESVVLRTSQDHRNVQKSYGLYKISVVRTLAQEALGSN